MASQKDFNKAYKEGQLAYKEGKPVKACPYTVPEYEDKYDSVWLLSANWLNGWRSSFIEDKKYHFGLITSHPNENIQLRNKITHKRDPQKEKKYCPTCHQKIKSEHGC